MLKYLIIPLASDAVSFCHYPVSTMTCEWISELTLRKAIVWAMKENVSIQFVYPSCIIPKNLAGVVETIGHSKIVPFNYSDVELLKEADIVVFDKITELAKYHFISGQSYAVKTSFEELIKSEKVIISTLPQVDRLNIVIEDIESIDLENLAEYQKFLESLIPIIIKEYKNGHYLQLNLLTDRLMINEMNNCNAGNESITLALDGKFYICPAFYLDGEVSIGDLETGINLKNPQLFKLSHAPICRICDAFQCKRCIWLNKKMTNEVNTPSRQQCIVAHTERNASKKLLEEFRKLDPSYLPEAKIPEIDYLDPFDKLIR